MPAPYSRILQITAAMTARLKALIGTGGSLVPVGEPTYALALTSFYEFKQPRDKGVTHPACLLVPVPEELQPGTNVSDDCRHGVQVVFTQISNSNVAAAHYDRVMYWRQVALEEFSNRRLVGMTEIYCTVNPQTILEPTAFAGGFDATSLVVRASKRFTNR